MCFLASQALLQSTAPDVLQVPECSLGFGHSCASNIVFGILDIFRRDDASFVAADRRRAPGFFAACDSVASQTGSDERRLAVVNMYTDDPPSPW